MICQPAWTPYINRLVVREPVSAVGQRRGYRGGHDADTVAAIYVGSCARALYCVWRTPSAYSLGRNKRSLNGNGDTDERIAPRNGKFPATAGNRDCSGWVHA